MQLYVLDRSKNVLATTSSQYNDKHHKELTAGASSFQFDISKSDPATEYMVSGNYITTLDDQGRPWSFTILYYDEYQLYKTIYCEDVGIELYNKACDVWYYPDAHPFEYYFDLVTDGTPWELGINQLSDLSRSLKYTGRDTGLGRMLSILKAFDDAECTFNIQMKGPVPVKYVIDVYKKIGTVQDNIQIAYNEELNDIKKTETRQEFATALAGVGSVIQNTEADADGSPVDTDKPQEYVDFADLEFDDGDFYTTKGDKFIRARTANRQFNPGDQGFIEDFYEYDTASNTELFNRTLAQIQKRSQPQFTYEADVKVIDPSLDIGDTVTIIDHDYNPALYLQARVATLEKSYTDTTKGSITFTNYVVLTDTVTRQIAALRSKVNGIKNGSSSYVWIRYADDDKGTGISQSPKDKTYVAILAKVNQPVPSDDPNDYAGRWVRIAGEDGLNGQIGPQGHDGADGIPGKDGRTSYTHIAYADTATGDGFSQSSDNKKYIGIYTDFDADDSSDVTKYNWSLIKGADGANGKDGIPGKAGADGRTPYFHIAYADSSDGNTNFSLDTPGSRKYIGSYTDFTQADSTNQAIYSWQLVQGPKGDTGADGVAGKDGVGIKSTAIAYQLSSSGTTAPIGTWSATVPTLTKGQYLWTRTTLTYTDNSGELVYSVSYVAKDGNNGTDGVAGKDGVGIKSTTITYQSGTSGTVQPTGTWVASPPSVAGGNYLWTRTVWSYTDGTSETGYSVARAGEKGDKGEKGLQGLQGTDGKDGIQGPKGADGKSSYTHIAYGTSNTGAGFTQAPSASTTYIGMYVNQTATDSDDPSKYKWTLIKGADGSQGTPGKPGADGKTPYLHTAYSWSDDGTDRFTTVYPGENLLTGTSSDLKTVTGSGWGSTSGYNASGTYGAGKYYASAYIENTTPVQLNIFIRVKGHSGNFSGSTIQAGKSGIVSSTFDILDGQSLDSAWVSFSNTQTESYTYKYKEMMITRTPSTWVPSPLDDPEGAYPKFIGTYTDYIADDSTDPSKYTWAKLRGEQGPKGDSGADGKPGKDGVGIKTTVITYAISTSGTTAPTTGWTSSVPSLVKGQYLWTKTVWTYTDNSFETGYSVTYISKDGNNGSNGLAGKDGTGIKTTTITYAGSTSGTTAPTSGWTSTVPTVAAGSYLWTKTVWAYTDNTSETGYSVAMMGVKGDTGVRGLQGVKGDQGIKGPAGTDGKTSYTHIAYANSATGEGFSEQPAGKTYIGMYVNFESTDSTDVTKYNWSLVKGSDGANGTPGKAGADGKTPYLHIAYADSADGKNGFYVGGGRNYLVNSSNFSNVNHWSNNDGTTLSVQDGCLSVFKNTSSNYRGVVQIVNISPNDLGKNFTATTVVKNASDSTAKDMHLITHFLDSSFQVVAQNSVDRKDLSLSSDFQIFEFNGAIPNDSRVVALRLIFLTNNSATVYHVLHKSFKFELGDIATPWSPAPSEAHPIYMGTYTDYIQADSLDPTAYLWSQIKGEDGANGKDGQDAYLHIAYANSVDGKTDFTTDQNQAHNRDYLGTYSDNTKAQSTDPAKYTWQLTRGAQGLQGQPGSKDVPVVTMSSTAPPSPKNGDFWYQTTTDSSGQKITGFSVYSSGKWVPSKIDQSTLVLTKLVSVEIDSATINSPDITVPFDYFDESQNEYKGSMEFKDGMLKHISTMTGRGMLKTVISPTGYTLDAYANQSEYTKNNPYIHTEVYADNISLSNANTKKSGIMDSSGIGGTLNDSTDSSIGINMNWSEVQKYLPEMGQNGSKRAFNWFDMMASSHSHPNLIKNSSFTSYYDGWNHDNADQRSWFIWKNLVDGNMETVDHPTGGAAHYLGQNISHLMSDVQMCYSFRYRFEGTLSTGSGVMFKVFDNNGNELQSWVTKVDPTGANTNDWYYLAINPITLPPNADHGYWTFTHNDDMTIHFAQPMLNYGSYAAPYMPT